MKSTVKPKTLRKWSNGPTSKVGKLIPIIYGMPGCELIEQSNRGEIELGGCDESQVFCWAFGFISGDPELLCPQCEGRFFRNQGSTLVEVLGHGLEGTLLQLTRPAVIPA